MKVIARGRCSGKTMELVKESAMTGSYILVRDRSMVQEVEKLAIKMNLKIPYPITPDEIQRGKAYGTSIKRDGVLVDNAELVLQQLLGVKINALTVSIFELEDDE